MRLAYARCRSHLRHSEPLDVSMCACLLASRGSEKPLLDASTDKARPRVLALIKKTFSLLEDMFSVLV